MRAFRTILTLLLALAWMPLTAHCRLESVTTWQALRCTTLEADGSCDSSPCGGAGSCCAWESGQYRLPASQGQVAAPILAVALEIAPLINLREEAPKASVLADAPPQPPKPWQFSLRSALPGRAPSIAS